ncbi:MULTISPECIES: S9 family peptidase [unclassified Curtobacterium]|uniref:S9 family peptidase n=1 Tax=unclassified Curtobacterium TaxID=257496 RepID=UPI000F47F874|nr:MULTISPECIES: S9 family peptidase [unclassified Curtobacterium]ROQ17264.1 dipeptidyl aminopeptidase/acylaminoacyl peptidase [Curtobacterium sp. PhB171]ROQ29492.1 dipeptidyl aminopeptidase/acylaminoacyl peptidase [Curtobacterium sp. PhB170]ROS45363.1 dipeptidyl aminopeptidase/acylaminoacyl peptidase [Curtobacterium sp. PhB131]ROS65929.1 dipeptidyl aminopeptidase/acylaminoacyl peptidase [Curtobacterium sp. PhB141]
MLANDISHLHVPSSPTVSGDPGDGGAAFVAVSRPDLEQDAYRSTIERVTTEGAVRWTSGDRDSSPALSPDGRALAFLRSVQDDHGVAHPQLAVAPVHGGEARVVTALPLGAGTPVWSPDSTRVAVTARFPEPGRYGSAVPGGDRRPAAAAEAPRLVSRLDFHVDGTGYLLDKPQQLVVVDVTDPGAAPVDTPLTSAPCSVSAPAWYPDGGALLVVAPRDLGERETHDDDLYRVDASDGTMTLAVRTEGSVSSIAIAPDRTVHYVGASHRDGRLVGEPEGLWVAAHDSEPVRLTARETVDVSGTPAFHRDDVLVQVLDRGTVTVRRVPAGTTAPLRLDQLGVVLGGRLVVSGFDVDGDVLVATAATTDSPGEVHVVDLTASDDAVPTVLTDYAAPLRSGASAPGVRRIEELTGTAPDGTPVHGWVVLPEGEGPHPVLRVVHGGPFGQDTWAFFDEAQVYASAGYAVVIGNPRGSGGYGLDHGRAVIGAMGTVDVDDVLALLDAALERPDLDAARVGIMGGSYGGFMTSWVAAHHGERFVAAWSERAVNAWDSFAGSSDIGWYFADAYVGADPEEQRRRSPLTYAAQVTIPFMVAHSEADWRCPIEQGQRQFVALRRAGVDASFLVFPGEGHELSRSGTPWHRVQRFEHVLAWWAQHLPVTPVDAGR